MPSSRITTDIPTADELFGLLHRKLKRTAVLTTERKLASGEYVIHEGRPVPAVVVAEAKAEAEAEEKQRYQDRWDQFRREQIQSLAARRLHPTVRVSKRGTVKPRVRDTRKELMTDQIRKAIHAALNHESEPVYASGKALTGGVVFRDRKVK